MIIDAVFKEEDAMPADFGVVSKGLKGEPDYSLVANAIKGIAMGSNMVVLADVAPLEHKMKVSVVGVDDPAAVTLSRYGATESDNFKTYKPKADGTVEGVTSIYPTTTLVCDTEGATIEVEYNRDLNKVLADQNEDIKEELGKKTDVLFKYDFNGDGVVDFNDALYIEYHIFFPNRYPIPSWCDPDVNGDGVVDGNEGVDLREKIANGTAFDVVSIVSLLDKKLDIDTYANTVANAIKGKVTGTVVCLPDVSPIPHPISVKVSVEPTVSDSIDSVEEASHNLPESGFYTVESIESSRLEGAEEGSSITFSNGFYWDSYNYLGDKVSVGDVLYYDENREHTDFDTEGALCLTIPVDYTTVEVDRYNSKNYAPKTEHTWTGSWEFIINEPLKASKTYKVLYDISNDDETANYVRLYDGINGANYDMSKAQNERNLTIKNKDTNKFFLHASTSLATSKTITAVLKKFVIVEAQDPIPYTPNDDGTVDEIVGNGEPMTLVSDTSGVVISAEYCKDLMKVLDEMNKKITALSAAVVNNV